MYRDFVNGSVKEGVKQTDITLFIAQKLVDNMDRYSSRAVASVCDVLKEMMRQNPDISFEEYLRIQKHLRRL